MSVRDVASRPGLEQQKLHRTREKFEQLLNVDPASPAFERLFHEVDGLLTSLVQDEGYRLDGVASLIEDEVDVPSSATATLTKGS